MNSQVHHPIALPFLEEGGECGRLLRERDWSRSPLGQPAQWPQELRTVVGIMLGSRQPMLIVWGPHQITLYNDGYAVMCGNRHPRALANSFKDLWFDIWDNVEPILLRAYAGEATHMDDIEFLMHRNGYPEETHFAFSYTPVRNGDGAVLGMFCACTETTQQVISERGRKVAEAAQRSGEEQLRVITDALPILIAYIDRDERYRFVNNRYETWFGVDQSEILGKHVSELVGTEAYQFRKPLMDQAFSGEHVTFEAFLPSSNGPRSCEMQYIPRRDDTGQIIGLYVMVIDVTARLASEKALRDSEVRFRGIADATPGFVWTALADGTIDYTSPRWVAYSGASATPMQGMEGLSPLHPQDRRTVKDAWTKAIATGEIFETEFRLRRRDGVFRWWLGRALPMFGTDGKIEHWSGVCTDIEEIVQARQTLAASREALEHEIALRTADVERMWRLSTDIMLVADFESKIKSTNPAWDILLGWSSDELSARHFMDLVHPDDIDATLGEVGKLAQGVKILSFENRYRHKDGSYRWISWIAVPDKDFIHAVGRDSTAQRHAAAELEQMQGTLRQAQKMEAVGQLTGGIAHDFNNLLQGIIGSLDLVQTRVRQGRIGEIDRYIDGAMNSANRAAALTHRLLAFSRRQPLDPRPTDANSLIGSMQDLLLRTMGEHIICEFERDAALWPTLCDPNQLENAILNLAINARDAMPDGGTLIIKTENTTHTAPLATTVGGLKAGDYVKISVSDTGTGMTPETIQRAFDPFFTTKPTGQGTGLGLSMIYGFAHQSEGSVEVTSVLGKGSEFTIYLPRIGGLPDLESAPEGLGEHHRTLGNERVIVIEDEPIVRSLIVNVLNDLGYSALEAHDGPSGLALLEQEGDIDLLITDIGLPGINGRQLADAARKTRPDIAVLLMTGYAESANSAAEFLDPGMELLTKPFPMEVLATRIRSLLNTDE